MKEMLTFSPTFNPAARTLDFSGYANFSIEKLYTIINVTRETPIYIVGKAASGISAQVGDLITLDFDTTTHNAADKLMILYETEDKPSTETTLSAVRELSQEIKDLNENLLLIFSSILEKMPRVTGNDQAAVSVEGTVTVAGNLTTVTNVTNLSTLATLSNANAAGSKFLLGDNINMGGVSHIYDKLEIS